MNAGGKLDGIAQTVIQLFIQLQRSGYTDEQLLSVRRAYELAMRLFTGSYSGSGKTTVSHLIGTASILEKLSAPVPMVIAGLLHSAYMTGDFGEAAATITSGKRERVTSAVGSNVEEYLLRFAQLRWWPKDLSSILASMDSLGSVDRDVLLIRLADDLDRYCDLGSLYMYRDTAEAREFIISYGETMVAIANKLDCPALSDALRRVFEETINARIPIFLRDLKWPESSPVIAPASYRKRDGE